MSAAQRRKGAAATLALGPVELVVEGTPRGKGRPRFDGRNRRTFTDDATVSHEGLIIFAWAQAGRPRLPDVALTMSVELVVERPRAHWRADGTLNPAGERTVWPAGRKPDVDNALKLAMDALNGKAYRDDVQIVRARVVRRWANAQEPEHTRITLDAAQTPAVTGLAA